MATKGWHTQALVLLLRDLVHPRAIEERLADFNVIGLSDREPKRKADSWSAIMHCPSAVVPYRPDEYGYVWIDIIDGTWPDSMGDTNEQRELFAAWMAAYFGPGAVLLLTVVFAGLYGVARAALWWAGRRRGRRGYRSTGAIDSSAQGLRPLPRRTR